LGAGGAVTTSASALADAEDFRFGMLGELSDVFFE
jgi:hypothetical protein